MNVTGVFETISRDILYALRTFCTSPYLHWPPVSFWRNVLRGSMAMVPALHERCSRLYLVEMCVRCGHCGCSFGR
jgi:hypothetical protein